MKRSFLFTTSLLLILTFFILQSNALVSSPFAVSSSGIVNYNATPEDGWLHTDGIYVKDSQGRIVAMRMVADFDWYFPTVEFIQNAKAHGINVIQLGFRPPSTDGGLGFSFDYDTQIDELDAVVNLGKQHGVYVGLVYLHATTPLSQQYGITGVDNVINHLLQIWTPIIEHYKNEPAVVGVKLIDEPNLSAEDEAKLWKETIGNLRQINPNLLWFTHTITERRFGEQYWHLIPWKTPEDVPYPNIIMDGGIWISSTQPPYDFEPDDYAGADEVFNWVTADMAHFRDKIQIPTGITPGISDYYAEDTARTYFLTKIHRWMEENRYILTFYASEYQLAGDAGLACFSKVFPDTPYSYYW